MFWTPRGRLRSRPLPSAGPPRDVPWCPAYSPGLTSSPQLGSEAPARPAAPCADTSAQGETSPSKCQIPPTPHPLRPAGMQTTRNEAQATAPGPGPSSPNLPAVRGSSPAGRAACGRAESDGGDAVPWPGTASLSLLACLSSHPPAGPGEDCLANSLALPHHGQHSPGCSRASNPNSPSPSGGRSSLAGSRRAGPGERGSWREQGLFPGQEPMRIVLPISQTRR